MKTRKMIGRQTTIIEACEDSALFKRWFRDRASWEAWFTFLAALFALPMTPEQLAVYRECTGRTAPPTSPANEAWLVCGRRAGKSFILALTAVYLATFKDWRPYLTAGERGVVTIVAGDKKQAAVIFRYCAAFFESIPMLAGMIERQTASEIELANMTTIEIVTCSFRTIRGRTVVAALFDEMAFWPTDEGASNPDFEVIKAVRPAMATIPGAMLLCASSPYARRGALYEAYRRHYGIDGQVLVWKAATRTMNPSVPQGFIDDAVAADPASAAAEYLAEFRSDIEQFISLDVVERAVVVGRHELPPVRGTIYTAFVDPSGGSSDSMTLAIAHLDDAGRVVVDLVREAKPPFSPDHTVAEFATLLRAYHLDRVTGDRYAGEWPRERFAAYGVAYGPSNKSKSDLYLNVLAPLNSGTVELLDHPRLVSQLVGLERRTARGGRDSIDHAPGAHDDLINAVAGAIVNTLMPESGANHWLTYMRRECERVALTPASTPPPPFGWNFGNAPAPVSPPPTAGDWLQAQADSGDRDRQLLDVLRAAPRRELF